MQVSFNIEISYFEIYNEKIHDLLCPSVKDKQGKKPSVSYACLCLCPEEDIPSDIDWFFVWEDSYLLVHFILNDCREDVICLKMIRLMSVLFCYLQYTRNSFCGICDDIQPFGLFL